MSTRLILTAVFLGLSLVPAWAEPAPRRVALVIGQNAYAGLKPLDNPAQDAKRMAGLLTANGFDVIACDGKTPGCIDLTRDGLVRALAALAIKAKGADLALVFYAGHGLETDAGNVLAPIDASVDCQTYAITRGVLIEEMLAATQSAKHKVVILDACRNQPLGQVCGPAVPGKKLSFRRIEAGDMRNLLLVSSTQFGQEALDGAKGAHSPFARALFAALEANPRIYFDQLLNQVAKDTYATGQGLKPPFNQIPGRVVGGEAPPDCLAGRDCVGDIRMSALADEIKTLAAESAAAQADASGIRNMIAADEKARGKPYTLEERGKRIAELGVTLASIGASGDPLRQEAKRLIDAGEIAGGQMKLDQALDAEEKAASVAEQMVVNKRKAAARSARDLAVLSRGSNIAKAADYYKRATGLDPADAQTWEDYAGAAVDAGRLGEAKAAFEQAALKARDGGNDRLRYWATLGQGDVALAQGSLPSARRLYETAAAIAAAVVKANPDDRDWQRNVSVSSEKVGDVLVAQGALPDALEAYRDDLAISERLIKSDPGNSTRQRDLAVSYNKVGDVLVAQGALPDALKAYRDSLAIAERLTKADPANALWQRDLSVSSDRIGGVLVAQGALPDALKAYRDSLAIRDRLAKSDPGNTGWQRDLSVSYNRIGDVLVAQGELPEALKAYRDDLAIAERLAKADPENAVWRRDLSVSYDKVGNVLVAQGALPDALKAYRDSLAIRNRLAIADPGNAGWQRDVSVSYEKLGDVLVAQGALPDALKTYRDSLAIRDRLAKADPGNAGWQRDLSVAHDKIGRRLEKQGDLTEALVHYREDLAIAERLAARDRSNATWQKDVEISRARMKRLEGK